MGNELQYSKRLALIALWKKGAPVAKAAAAVGMRPAAAGYWIHRYQATKSVKDAPRSGRPRKLSGAAIAKAQDAVLASQNVRVATRELARDGVIPAGTSTSTVYRSLGKGPGAVKCKGVRKVPIIDTKKAEARLAFARHHKNAKTRWHKVLFVDSKYFYVSRRTTKKLWVRAGDTAQQHGARKGEGLHVYGAFCAAGTVRLIKVTGGKYQWMKGTPGVRSAEYIQVLKEYLLPAANKLFKGKRWQLLHDGAGPHVKAETQAFLKKQGVQQVARWPANSPELNPIENLWSWAQREINKQDIYTMGELERAVVAVWRRVPLSMLHNLASSMTTRLTKVEAAGGKTIRY